MKNNSTDFSRKRYKQSLGLHVEESLLMSQELENNIAALPSAWRPCSLEVPTVRDISKVKNSDIDK